MGARTLGSYIVPLATHATVYYVFGSILWSYTVSLECP